MPLTPHFTWSETDASLEVAVEVPGVSRGKADVFATDAFLKVNSPPYLFALDLSKEVDDARSSATILTGKVVFQLFKRDPGLWGMLASSSPDKAALAARRNESIDRAYRAVEEARKARVARKAQEDKNAAQRGMDVDRRKRQEVDRRKAAELAEERGRLAEWKAGLAEQDNESDYEEEEQEEEQAAAGAGERLTAGGEEAEATSTSTLPPDHPDYHGRGWRRPAGAASVPAATSTAAAKPAAARPPAGRSGRSGDSSSEEDDEDGDERRRLGGLVEETWDDVPAAAAPAATAVAERPASFKPLPPPRAKLQPVQVNFTKLETGHLPARATREDEIRAFRKQTRALPEADSVDLSERQPLFLKDKGDGMFKAGNYSGALNAYSRAIALEDSHPAIRANRAACRLALGDATGCAADCDRALELLADARGRLERDLLDGPEAAALGRQLVRLLVRRAQARVALMGGGGGGGQAAGGGSDLLCAALRDYEDALRLAPSDTALAADREELLAAMAPADSAALRQRGDARFRSGDYEGALEAFSALVGLPRSRVPEAERLAAFSNRAACQLVMERYGPAVADCDAGLALLLPSSSSAADSSAPSSATVSLSGFGAAAGEQGRARLAEWAQTLALPGDAGQGADAGDAEPSCSTSASSGLAPPVAAAAAARLLMRRGAAAAHLQHFDAAAADHDLAAALLRRLGEEGRGKAEAAEADATRLRALAEGREQLPPRPLAAPPVPVAAAVATAAPEEEKQDEVAPSGNGREEATQGAEAGGTAAPSLGVEEGAAEVAAEVEVGKDPVVHSSGSTGGVTVGVSLLDEVDD